MLANKKGERLRLSAIVFTDIVGYSALVHRSPDLGKMLLDRQRQVIRKLVPAYGGREIETAGDSFLLEFDGAYTALACVAEIQRGLNKANAELPPADRVTVRAGIHVGDVEHRGDEIFGDGVNIAARILPYSPEGGVAFSELVHLQVHSRIEGRAQSLGEHQLKNIPHPVEIFTLDAAAVCALESNLIGNSASMPAVHPALYDTRGRHGAGESPGVSLSWRFGDACFNERTLELTVGGELAELERKPLEVLRHLLWHANEVVTKDELLDAVWPGRVLSESVLKKAVSRVRAALKDDDEEVVKTVRGYGYRLVAPVSIERSGSAAAAPPRMNFKAGDEVALRPKMRLVRRLGTGGHGEAWLAEHEKSRERRAYKFAIDEGGVRALKREITLYRLLLDTLGERTDLVRILDWNLEQEPYFTEAEYVAGGNLLDWAEAQGGLTRVPLEQRIDLAAQIAETLAAAHSVAVLHKDLKPSNIFIGAAEGKAVRAKIADFGSGTVLDPDRLDQLGITRLGLTQAGDADAMLGTPLYLAPECAIGQPATVQADVYSLGIVLYQLVVGDLRKPMAPGWEADVADELLREDIAAAANGNFRLRLADAGSLAQRLRTLESRRFERIAERTAQARAEQAARSLEHYRARRSGLLVAVAALAIGLGASLVLYAQARGARQEAEQHAAEAEAASQFLMRDVLSGIDPGQHDIKAMAGAKQLIDAGVRKLDKRFARQPELAAQIRHRFILAYFSLGFVGEGMSLGEQVREQAQQALRQGAPEALPLGLMLAEDAPNIGIREQDQPYWSALRDLAQKKLAPDDPQLMRVHFVLGLLLAQRGDYDAARQELQRIASVEDKAGYGGDHFDLEALGALASVQADLGDLEAAETTLRRAIERGSGVVGTSSGVVLAQRARLTRILGDRGHYDEAQHEVEDALAIARHTRGPGNTLVIELELAQALLQAEQGQLKEALAQMQPAVQAFAAGGTPDDDGVLLAFQNALARVQQWAGQLDAAEQGLRRIIVVEQRNAPPDSIRLAQSQLALADVLRQQGRAVEARQLLAALPQGAVARLKAGPASAAELQRVDGLVTLAEGRRQEGIAMAEEALQQQRRMFGDNHWWIKQTQEVLDSAPDRR